MTLNKSINSAGSTPATSMTKQGNLTFAGSENVNGATIYGSKWQVIPRTFSTTISVDQEYIDEVLYHIRAISGPPQDNGSKGLIFRDSEPAATVTVYISTGTINVQGVNHQQWIETVLPKIESRIDGDVSEQDDDDEDDGSEYYTEDFSTSFSSTEDPVLLESLARSSTPAPTPQLASTQTHNPIKNTGTQHGPSIKYVRDLELQNEKLINCNEDLKNHNTNIKKELKDMRELYNQLAQSFNSMCERNALLQAKVESLTAARQSMSSPRIKSTPARTQVAHDAPNSVPTSNMYSVLEVEETPVPPPTAAAAQSSRLRPTAPSFVISTPPAPSHRATPTAPPMSLMTPMAHHQNRIHQHQNSRSPHRQQEAFSPPRVVKPVQQTHDRPDIIIFSNSMYSRMRPHRFCRGKNTKLIAKSGASIADISKEIRDYQGDTAAVKCIILQAWTNTTARADIETCDRQSRDLIEATLQKFPNAKVLVSSVLPRLHHNNRVAQELNIIFARNAEQSARVFFVDHTPIFTRGSKIAVELFWDNVHLKDYGLGKLIHNLRVNINKHVFPHRYHTQIAP